MQVGTWHAYRWISGGLKFVEKICLKTNADKRDSFFFFWLLESAVLILLFELNDTLWWWNQSNSLIVTLDQVELERLNRKNRDILRHDRCLPQPKNHYVAKIIIIGFVEQNRWRKLNWHLCCDVRQCNTCSSHHLTTTAPFAHESSITGRPFKHCIESSFG